MASVVTKKGTELPLLNLKGKDYLQAAHRLVWLREDHPEWSLETEFVRLEETFAIVKATIRDDSGRVISCAHKREDKAHFPDFIEKAETGALARAAGVAGYGTAFAEELADGALANRPADAPAAPKKAAEKLPVPGQAKSFSSGGKF